MRRRTNFDRNEVLAAESVSIVPENGGLHIHARLKDGRMVCMPLDTEEAVSVANDILDKAAAMQGKPEEVVCAHCGVHDVPSRMDWIPEHDLGPGYWSCRKCSDE